MAFAKAAMVFESVIVTGVGGRLVARWSTTVTDVAVVNASGSVAAVEAKTTASAAMVVKATFVIVAERSAQPRRANDAGMQERRDPGVG
jgi:hypothetical protein